MAKYGNENAAAGGRSRDTAGRDRSYGGGGGFGGGGSGAGGGRAPQGAYNPRYEQRTVPGYQATPGNMAKLLGGAAMGMAMPGLGIGLGPMMSDMMGFGYDNPTGPTKSFSYDNKGDFGYSGGMGGAPARPGVGGNPTAYQQYMQRVKAAAAPPSPAPVAPVKPMPNSFTPQMFMGTGGKFGYGVQRPGYSFFGPGSI